ncbi:unnamed protein product [Protopolystoma xenopodis]|uniref:Uncharacterized protein n=1 Tax=Protopolystoma xenopodis TaxID=117903 RepID=A0A448WT52_9PLAT|nr:unnamed protein product [Protopolystoma xenopodis]
MLVSLAASISKSFRHRAINTDPVCNEEKETNTRPRGVNSTLSFLGTTSNGILGENGHSEDVDTVTMGLDEMLTTDLDSLDNLTRARMRRKLRERWNTVASEDGHGDEHGLSGAIGATEGNVGTSGGHTSHHYLMQHPASAGRNGLTEAIDHSHPSSVYSARRSSAVQQSYRPW